MGEMRDSSALAADPRGLRDRIRAEGYVLLRGLVDRDTARAVGAAMRAILAAHGWTRPDGTVLRTPAGAVEPDDYWPMYAEVLGLEAFNALAWEPPLRAAMTALLGPRAFTFPMKTPRMVFPEPLGGRTTPVHRDNRSGPWVRDLFTTWVALDDVTPELGGLALLPGSHTYRDDAGGGWVGAELAPGDVLVFHCYTLHRGVPNRSGRVRLSADFRWQSADHAVHVSALMPYQYFERHPRVPGWRALTEGWRSRRWCSYPAGLEVLRTKWPDGAGPAVPPSEFVDVAPGARESWRPEIRLDEVYGTPCELPAPA